MKSALRRAFLPILAGLFATSAAATDPKELSLLFIGNSMSASAGGQHEIVPALLRARGWTVATASSFGPGMTLAAHWFNNLGEMDRWRQDQIDANLRRIEERRAAREAHEREWEDEIARRDSFLKRKGTLDAAIEAHARWDVVLLQTGSREPQDPDYFQTHEAAPLLIGKIHAHSPAARIILYQPWPAGATADEVARYASFRHEMVERYALDGAIPMFEAMLHAREERPSLSIHRSPGNVHPGVDGGYLIACLIFCAITGEDPAGLPSTFEIAATYDHAATTFSIPEATAKFLQEVAWRFLREHRQDPASAAADPAG